MYWKNFVLSTLGTLGSWWAAYTPVLEGLPRWMASIAGAVAAFYFALKTRNDYLISKESLNEKRNK